MAKGQYFTGMGEWGYLGDAITQVIASGPDTPFEISVRISGYGTDNEE